MNHLDCKLGWMKQQARIFASDSAWVTTAANVPSLKAWYRADTTVNGGGTVSQLTDKSGGGFHLTQATGTKQPALNVADANMGGRDSITFDGVDDALGMVSPAYGALAALTLYLVVRGVIAESSKRYFVIGNNGSAESIQIQNTASNGRPLFAYERAVGNITTRRFDNGVPASTGDIRIYAATVDCAAAAASSIVTRCRLRAINTSNIVNGSGTGVAISSTHNAVLGANNTSTTYFGSFTLAEFIVCNSVHSMDQMRKIELYLAGYYGLL